MALLVSNIRFLHVMRLVNEVKQHMDAVCAAQIKPKRYLTLRRTNRALL